MYQIFWPNIPESIVIEIYIENDRLGTHFCTYSLVHKIKGPVFANFCGSVSVRHLLLAAIWVYLTNHVFGENICLKYVVWRHFFWRLCLCDCDCCSATLCSQILTCCLLIYCKTINFISKYFSGFTRLKIVQNSEIFFTKMKKVTKILQFWFPNILSGWI